MNNKFDIIEKHTGSQYEIRLLNTVSGERITVIPSQGARLNEAVCIRDEKSYSILKKINPAELSSRDDVFNNAKLFPFAGRIKEGEYSFNGKDYSLPINYPEENNACHGFIYDKPFNLIDYTLGSDQAVLSFEYQHNEIFSGYPFQFSIIIKYTLHEKDGVKCSTKIKNNSVEKMLFSDGWHHYFTLNEKVNNLSLITEAAEVIELGENGIPTGNNIPADINAIKRINEENYDTVYRLCKKNIVTTSLYSEAENLKLCVWQEAGENKYRYLVVYIPPERQTIAIEPISSNINSFNNKLDLITLGSGGTWEADFGFYIK